MTRQNDDNVKAQTLVIELLIDENPNNTSLTREARLENERGSGERCGKAKRSSAS
jgi:hypothetical protein